MKHIRNNGGFTLIELLVSILVGAVLVSSVNTVYTTQLGLSQQARDTVVANSYAESKVEALRSKGYLSVSLGTTDLTSELPAELTPPRKSTLTVTTHSTSVKQLQLDITYNQSGRAKTYTYVTYLGELGVGQ